MQLTMTKQGEYGVRILIYLATLPEGTRVTGREFAEACSIPAGNVPTVVNRLSRGGFLSCTPGRNGGCTLARRPAEITLFEIAAYLEGDIGLSHCILDGHQWTGSDTECALHFAWIAGGTAAIAALSNMTLQAAAAREIYLRGPTVRPGQEPKPEPEVTEIDMS